MVKSIIWRFIGIIVLGLITWTYTKNVELTTMVTALFHSINVSLYYFHERFWDRIDWGLMKKTSYPKKINKKFKMIEKTRIFKIEKNH